ncbi:GSCOCG00000316001-RA-CDS, partial [Cotesia congregata]
MNGKNFALFQLNYTFYNSRHPLLILYLLFKSSLSIFFGVLFKSLLPILIGFVKNLSFFLGIAIFRSKIMDEFFFWTFILDPVVVKISLCGLSDTSLTFLFNKQFSIIFFSLNSLLTLMENGFCTSLVLLVSAFSLDKLFCSLSGSSV